MSRPQFDVKPFEPDHGCPFLGTLALLGVVILTGALAGWFVNRLLGNVSVCCGSGALQLLAIGWAIGAFGGYAVRLGRVRAPGFAGVTGVIGMFASAFGQLFSKYQDVLADPGQDQKALIAANQFSFIDYVETLGIGDVFPIGIGLLLGSGSCYAFMAAAATRPYDPVAEQWKTRVRLGRLRMPRSEAVRAIGSGDIARLATVELRRNEGVGLTLYAWVSPKGAPHATLELELEDFRGADKKKKHHAGKLGLWTYPGEALLVLDHLFPGVIEEELGIEDDSTPPQVEFD